MRQIERGCRRAAARSRQTDPAIDAADFEGAIVILDVTDRSLELAGGERAFVAGWCATGEPAATNSFVRGLALRRSADHG